MSAMGLLAELEAAGITLTPEGDRLRVRSASRASLATYTERIREEKPTLLTLLRERQAIAGLTASLEQGWDWLDEHPHHPEYEAFLERWTARLHEYERTYAAPLERGEASC